MKCCRLLLSVAMILGCVWVESSGVFAADLLVWQSSKDAAVSMAISQGKKILLFAGRETCGNCQYMKYTVCESSSPPIRSLLEEYFVIWFCPVDDSEEWYTYAYGLGSFSLPMICVIDPNYSNNYLDRTTGVQDTQVFYSRLLNQASTPTACNATIDEKLLLHIPYLSYNNGTLTLSADFVYDPNPSYPALIPFKLTNYVVINNPSFSCTASTLSANLKIHIPDVLFPDGITHLWLDLEYSPALSTGGNFYWVVSNYGAFSN